MNNCYKELPTGYVKHKVIDAKNDKKFIIILNIVATLTTVVLGILLVFINEKRYSLNNVFNSIIKSEIFLLVLALCTFAYLVLHELTHGIVYKMRTKEKLTFGFTLSVAYCGVPNVYVNKKTALCALCAPLIIYSVIFLLCGFLIPSAFVSCLFLILFAFHIGGCSGDIYDIYILLTKYDNSVLLNDNGPTQVFYVPQDFKKNKEQKIEEK